MAGLPRSGSTLLSSILNQNPRIHSGPSSPVHGLMLNLDTHIRTDELFRAFPKPTEANKIIGSIIDNFYSDVDHPIVIDKNRAWVNRPHYITGYLHTTPKIICPVRNIDEILTSFITMCRRNPFNGEKINFIDKMLIQANVELNDTERCRALVGPGIIGQSYDAIKQLLVDGKSDMLHFVEYNDLIRTPKEVMRKLYQFLGEKYYDHDFTNIVNVHPEQDMDVYGFADMHQVRPDISRLSPDPHDILPAGVIKSCVDAEFWRDFSTSNTNTTT
jgi:sulfotransferase